MSEVTQSRQKTTRFRWDRGKETAASLLAAGELTDEEIARQTDVSRQTLSGWKSIPEFASRVEEHREEFRKRVFSEGIARLENRVAALGDRWRRMQRVISERAEELEGEVAGGGTGLLVRDVKSIGKGEYAKEVEVYRVDTGLLRELREHEKQAAQELGQWTENRNLTGTVENVLTYSILPPNEEAPSLQPETEPLGEEKED